MQLALALLHASIVATNAEWFRVEGGSRDQNLARRRSGVLGYTPANAPLPDQDPSSDLVKIELTQYDLAKGRIVYRLK